ncbi:hypothetical protein [Halorussus litoreus]|uniref:hypothetical protein n=1 Tax=Halorussus litoreus TaxID=1710536 RepID=UPI000E288D47|nr:hypothetical protein [Halorussus litoreus]
MAHYIVRATPKMEKLAELRERLDREEFRDMNPFGRALTQSLENARFDPETEEAVWEEEDYCSPPLAMERDAVLEEYFEKLLVEEVRSGKGWERIDDLPSLWESSLALG